MLQRTYRLADRDATRCPLIGLTVVFAILFVTDRGGVHDDSSFRAVAAVGFLLLGGMRGAQLLEVFKLPHLTAYILVGVVGAPAKSAKPKTTALQIDVHRPIAASLVFAAVAPE